MVCACAADVDDGWWLLLMITAECCCDVVYEEDWHWLALLCYAANTMYVCDVCECVCESDRCFCEAEAMMLMMMEFDGDTFKTNAGTHS